MREVSIESNAFIFSKKNVPVSATTYNEFFHQFAKRGMTEKMRIYYSQLRKSEILV